MYGIEGLLTLQLTWQSGRAGTESDDHERAAVASQGATAPGGRTQERAQTRTGERSPAHCRTGTTLEGQETQPLQEPRTFQ